MLGLAERVEVLLDQPGVDRRYGAKLEGPSSAPDGAVDVSLADGVGGRRFEAVFWSADNLEPLGKIAGLARARDARTLAVSMVRYVLLTDADDIEDVVYRHIFDDDALICRIAAQGRCSVQRDAQNRSFMTCECPAPRDRALWREADEAERIEAA